MDKGGKGPVKAVCKFLFANITSWNVAVQSEIREGAFDYIGLCETHVTEARIGTFAHELRRAGYGLSNIVAAECTSSTGSSGGLALAAQNPLHLGSPADSPRADRWQCAVVRLGKASVLVVNLYLYVDHGLSAENLAILGQIEQYGMEIAMPIIIGGRLQSNRR
jgi:hypothetical protein